MQRYPVNSTFARTVGYNHADFTLEIETYPSRNASGHIYQYRGISPRKYATFVMSPSLGKYYNRKIKGQFEEIEVFEQHEVGSGDNDTMKEIAVAVVNEIVLRLARPVKITK